MPAPAIGHGLPEFQRPPVEHKKAIVTLAIAFI